MADKKTNEEVEVLYAGLLAKHIFRGASDDATGNFFIYFSKLINGILGYTTYTVAGAQAAAIATDFIPGQRILISDPYGSANNEFRTVARSTSELEERGHGTYQNAAMTGPMDMTMGYDLTADYINYLYESTNNNEVIQTTGADLISKIPFDVIRGGGFGSIFNNNRFVDVAGTWVANATIITYTKAENCSITTAQIGSGDCYIVDADIRKNATISMTSDSGAFTYIAFAGVTVGSYLRGYVGYSATATIWKAAIGNYIGDQQIIDTSSLAAGGYAKTNGRLTADESTFRLTGTQKPALNPDGSAIIDMNGVAWAGEIVINDFSGSGGSILTIANATDGMKYMFIVDSAAGAPGTFDNSGGGLKMSAPFQIIPNDDQSSIIFYMRAPTAYERNVTILV